MFKVITDTVHNGLENEGEYETREEAELRMIDVIAYTNTHFNDYSASDLDVIRKRGYERIGMGTVFIEEDGVRPI